MAKSTARNEPGPDCVQASINYLGDMSVRPEFFAVDYSRDNLNIQPRTLPVRDARPLAGELALEREGFMLVSHRSAVTDFRDANQTREIYLPEIRSLMLSVTGAKEVIMTPGAVLRFGERSREFGSRVNTRPARFVHVDYTPASAPGLLKARLDAVGFQPAPGQRYAGYNIWRVLSPPPQDVPLALCDARTVSAQDLVPGDAIFDAPDAPEFRFEAYLLRHNPRHAWSYFRDMHPGEALIFKAYDTDPGMSQRVPHVAFNDPGCPADVSPRESIEVRCFAFF